MFLCYRSLALVYVTSTSGLLRRLDDSLHFVLAHQCVRHTTVFEVRRLTFLEDVANYWQLVVENRRKISRRALASVEIPSRLEPSYLAVSYTNSRNRTVFSFHIPWNQGDVISPALTGQGAVASEAEI